MKVINTSVSELQNKVLCIGFVGENERTQVRIDASAVFAEYPHATPSLAIKPPLGNTFPVLVDRDGTDVVWDVLNSDLQRQGDNEIQLTFIKDSVVCKSYIGKARVLRSLKVDGETPTPVESWTDAANAKLAEVDAAIVALDEIDATATGLPAGTAPTVEVQDVDDHKRLAFGIPKGDQGIQGIQGEKGDTGATPELTIGTVSTLPEGSSASASITGTAEHPVLSLGIPKGDTGARGQTGAKGDTGNGIASIVKTGSSGLDDTYTITYTNGTTTEFYVTNGKDGEDGQPGARGQTGATPDLTIGTVETLPAGSSATATITGTDEEPILNLGIPTGATGAQGEQGIQGEPGAGVPTGGYTGQVLAKASTTDRDTEWIDVAPIIHSTASGSIASFSDGAALPVDSVTCEINPVQDLHGYESPWPGGGGKNLFDIDKWTTLSSYPYSAQYSYYYSDLVQLKANTTYAVSSTGTAVTTTTYMVVQAYTDAETWNAEGSTVANIIQNGNMVASKTFTTGDTGRVRFGYRVASNVDASTEFALIKSTVKIQVEEGSAVTAWTPYSNICPITGHTAVNVTRNAGDYATSNSVYNGYTIGQNGQVSAESGMITTDYMPVSEGDSIHYYFVSTQGPRTRRVAGYNADKTFVSDLFSSTWATVDVAVDRTITIPAGIAFVRASYYDGDPNKSLVNKTYETTYPITIPSTPGTVYGGTLTVAEDGSGTLVVDRYEHTFDGTESSLVLDSSANVVRFTGVPAIDSTYSKAKYLYSHGVGDGSSTVNMRDNSFGARTTGYVYLKRKACTTLQDFKDWFAGEYANGTPVQISYLLATPETYTLTAAQITTLLGTNNVWHDANGNTEVGYKANTKLYIDGKIAELVAQIVNS